MKADSVKPASLSKKLGCRYIFYITIYNRHSDPCSLSANDYGLPRGTVDYPEVFRGHFMTCLTCSDTVMSYDTIPSFSAEPTGTKISTPLHATSVHKQI